MAPNLFTISNSVFLKNGASFDERLVTEEPDQLIDGSNYYVISNANGSNGSFINRAFHSGRSSSLRGTPRGSSGITQSVIRGTFQVASMDSFVLVKIPYQSKLSLEIFIPKSALRSVNQHARMNQSFSNKLSSFSVLSAIDQAKQMKLRIKMPKITLSSGGNFKQILASSNIGVINIFDPTLSELSETSNAFDISVSDIGYKNVFCFPSGRGQSADEKNLSAKNTDAKIPDANLQEASQLQKEHRSADSSRSADGRRSLSSIPPYRVYAGGARRNIQPRDQDNHEAPSDGSDKKDADKFIPITIHAPFIFLVRDEVTGHNLFLGKLMNPFSNN